MLIRSLVDPTLAVFVVCGPLQLFSLVKLLRFGAPTRQILTAPPQLRLWHASALKRNSLSRQNLNVLMFGLYLSKHIYFFAFRDTNRDTLVSLRLETLDVATRVSERKWVQIRKLGMVNGSLCSLCALALWLALHIFATQCWRAPRRAKQLSTVAILRYWFLSCWCLETFFRSISLAVFCLYTQPNIISSI